MTDMSLLAISLLAFGIFLELIALLFKKIADKKLFACTASTTAEVIEYKKKTSGSVDDIVSIEYHPVYSYTVGGKEYKYESARNSNRPGKDVGQVVPLKYNPGKPEIAYVEEDISLLKISKISFAVTGMLFIIAAIIFTIV